MTLHESGLLSGSSLGEAACALDDNGTFRLKAYCRGEANRQGPEDRRDKARRLSCSQADGYEDEKVLVGVSC